MAMSNDDLERLAEAMFCADGLDVRLVEEGQLTQREHEKLIALIAAKVTLTDEEIARLRTAEAKRIVQAAIDSGELMELPGGRVIETDKLTDEHRAEIAASKAQR